jgi:hypothetical protein
VKAKALNAKGVVAVLVLALAAYFVLIGYRAFYLLGLGRVEYKVLGAAVLILPLVGIWVVIAELRFGLATQRLAVALDDEGAPVDPELPRLPSGRVDRRVADGLFHMRRAEVEADPDNWRRWYDLARAYDLAGDRRRAREAMREAISRQSASAD